MEGDRLYVRLLIIIFGGFFIMTSEASTPAFSWDKVLILPPSWNHSKGNQVLHFSSGNKPFTLDQGAMQFVTDYLSEATPLTSDAAVIRFASDQVSLEGAYLEMGVCTGKTINFIAALNPSQRIHGFDSFQGLPEDWNRGDKNCLKGTFAFLDPEMLPYVLHNVQLHKGWFHEVLPQFLSETLQAQSIAFLHIDCDIYSSTRDVFTLLGDNIIPGTVIVFDELYNYPGCEEHEFKAFQEFLKRKGYRAKYLGYNTNHEQVVVKIIL
ncbi:MAG: TylF/MycF/NovP-related O-methyltransferase, partial [Simkaniaceae bacterium]|jgi:hypothetical protein